MHSATANDYVPNGPLLLAHTCLLLHGPECGSVPRSSLAGEETPLVQSCRDVPRVPGSATGKKGMGKRCRRGPPCGLCLGAAALPIPRQNNSSCGNVHPSKRHRNLWTCYIHHCHIYQCNTHMVLMNPAAPRKLQEAFTVAKMYLKGGGFSPRPC